MARKGDPVLGHSEGSRCQARFAPRATAQFILDRIRVIRAGGPTSTMPPFEHISILILLRWIRWAPARALQPGLEANHRRNQ